MRRSIESDTGGPTSHRLRHQGTARQRARHRRREMVRSAQSDCQISELRPIKTGLVIVTRPDWPTINIVVRANAQQDWMPGSAIGQTGDWNSAAFTIEIWNRYRCMHRMQNQDPNQQPTPETHNPSSPADCSDDEDCVTTPFAERQKSLSPPAGKENPSREHAITNLDIFNLTSGRQSMLLGAIAQAPGPIRKQSYAERVASRIGLQPA